MTFKDTVDDVRDKLKGIIEKVGANVKTIASDKLNRSINKTDLQIGIYTFVIPTVVVGAGIGMTIIGPYLSGAKNAYSSLGKAKSTFGKISNLIG
jgi:hypothetical protein